MDMKHWLLGLLATFINGFASGVVLAIAAPDVFNFSAGFVKLIQTSAALGVLGAANYLKKSPLPGTETTDTGTITKPKE